MNAEQTRILSASGSINLPKFVINVRLHAMALASQSVMLSAQNNASATVSYSGKSKNTATRNATVRTKRKTVNWFGRFMQWSGGGPSGTRRQTDHSGMHTGAESLRS